MLFEAWQRRKDPQKEFEFALSSLMYILGFAAVNLASTSRLRDAPDILCSTPSGQFAVVECTLMQPDREDKLSKLFTRAQAMRAALDQAGFQGRKLLPVLVTALPRAEVPQPELDNAQKLGIALAAREDLSDALQRSAYGEMAEDLYKRLAASIESDSGQLELQS